MAAAASQHAADAWAGKVPAAWAMQGLSECEIKPGVRRFHCEFLQLQCGLHRRYSVELCMPLGSPGMDGPDFDNQTQPYDVLLVLKDGTTRVFQSYHR